jgi:hypothetical protein
MAFTRLRLDVAFVFLVRVGAGAAFVGMLAGADEIACEAAAEPGAVYETSFEGTLSAPAVL